MEQFLESWGMFWNILVMSEWCWWNSASINAECHGPCLLLALESWKFGFAQVRTEAADE